MTLFHVQFGVVARSTGGDARKAAVYQMCARVECRDGTVFDFTRKKREHTGHAVMLPDGAPAWCAEPADLWQRAESAERRGDAQTARTVMIAIPRDVPSGERIDFVRTICEQWRAAGMIAQIDLHCTRAADGGEQPHAHVLLTLRRLDGDRFAATKERGWNKLFTDDKGRAMRGAIAAAANGWLAAHRIDARVDHRTHEEQGRTEPIAEPNIAVRAWRAHAADPASAAAAPVSDVIAARQTRSRARYEIAWQTARAAYATAAAEHYASERDRRAVAGAARQAAEKAARAALQARQRADRDRIYQTTRRGWWRTLRLAVNAPTLADERDHLAVAQQADRMTQGAAAAPLPGFEDWCKERGAAGDHVAAAAAAQIARRRAWLAKKDPAAAARATVAEAEQAAARVLRGAPRGETDADVIFSAAQKRVVARQRAATDRARAAAAAHIEHTRSATVWQRITSADWKKNDARLAEAARTAASAAATSAKYLARDTRIAREAARRAAARHAAERAAWTALPRVIEARATIEAAARARGSIEAGDAAAIEAAAGGDLAGAVAAAQAADLLRATAAAAMVDQERWRRAAEAGALAERRAAAAAAAAEVSERRLAEVPAGLVACAGAAAASVPVWRP